MSVNVELKDLQWLKDLDPDTTLEIRDNFGELEIWASFVAEAHELSDKLEKMQTGFTCLDVNVGTNCRNWKSVEMIGGLPQGHSEYRYLVGVGR